MQEDEVKIINDTALPSDIFGRAVKGGAWLFALRFLNQILSMIKLFILCRLLVPDDFGLLGVATLTIGIMVSFSEMGLENALIYQKQNDREHLDTAWTVGVVRGLILFAVMYFAAPFAADFFNRPDAEKVIKVIGISLVFESFINIGVVYFAKELEFHKRFAQEIVGTLVGSIVAIILAFVLRNVWALVYGKLAGSLTRFLMSYILHPYRPRLFFNANKMNDLWGFGKHVFGTTILKFFCLHSDDIFVGKMLGVSALGFYQQAFNIGTMVANEIGNKIAEVSFPAYSKLQGNLDKLRGGFLKSVQVSSLLVFPIAGSIIVLAHEFVGNVLGDKWLPMVPALQILCILGPIKCMQKGSVFMALGRPDILTKFGALRLVLMLISIYPLTIKYGIAGTSFCVLLPSFIMQPLGFYMLKKLTGIRLRSVIALLLYPVGATVLMMLSVLVMKYYIGDVGLVWLLLLMCQCVIVYCVAIILMSFLSKEFSIINLAKDIIKGLK